MAKLDALTPAAGLLPVTVGTVTLSEIVPDGLWSIAPFKGQTVEGLPKVGRSSGKAGSEMVWFAQGQFMAIGTLPDGLAGKAAVTDQSDEWCVLEISGEDAEDALARLVPIDLRQAGFKRGHCARSQLGHMSVHITRMGPKAFRLMAFRSMAATMVHELERAMTGIAARG